MISAFTNTDHRLGGVGGTIGGSIVGAIMGVSPYMSPHDAWARLVWGRVAIDSPAMARGRRMEPIVTELVGEALGLELRPPIVQTFDWPDDPRFTASIDAEAFEPDGTLAGIVEIKSASARKKWGRRPPPDYLLQVQHYMHIRGVDHAWLGCLQADDGVFTMIGNADAARYAIEMGVAKLHVHDIPKDPKYSSEVVPYLTEWFEKYVVTREPPPVDGSDGCAAALVRHFGKRAGDIEADSEIEELARQREEYDRIAKQATANRKLVDNQLRARLEGNRVAKNDSCRVTISTVPGRPRFSQSAFKADHPELFEEYLVRGHDHDRITVKVFGEGSE